MILDMKKYIKLIGDTHTYEVADFWNLTDVDLFFRYDYSDMMIRVLNIDEFRYKSGSFYVLEADYSKGLKQIDERE